MPKTVTATICATLDAVKETQACLQLTHAHQKAAYGMQLAHVRAFISCFLCRPQYDTTVQFVIEADLFQEIGEAKECMTIILHRSIGLQHEMLGRACITMSELLSNLQLGIGVAKHSTCHDAQVRINIRVSICSWH